MSMLAGLDVYASSMTSPRTTYLGATPFLRYQLRKRYPKCLKCLIPAALTARLHKKAFCTNHEIWVGEGVDTLKHRLEVVVGILH